MKLKNLLINIPLWILFAIGLAAGLAPGIVTGLLTRNVVIAGHPLVIDGTREQMLKYAGIGLSLVAGTLAARREPLKSLLSARPTLWFLFLFNAAVAVIAFFALSGVQGIATAIGMGVVSLGAAGGLFMGGKKPAAGREMSSTHKMNSRPDLR